MLFKCRIVFYSILKLNFVFYKKKVFWFFFGSESFDEIMFYLSYRKYFV